jgi:hypothetical protein
MANIFQRAWNDVTGWLNTPQGRQLSADTVTPDNQPRYFPDQRTMLPTGEVTGAPTGAWVYPTTMQPTGRVTGEPGDAFRGPPVSQAAPSYFSASRVRGGQPMPAQPFRYPEIRSEGTPYTPAPVQGVAWSPNAPAPVQPAAQTPTTGIDPYQFARGNTPQGGGPSMSPGATAPNVPPSVPSQPVIRPSGATTGLGGFGSQTIQGGATGPADWRGYQTGGTDASGQPIEAPSQPVAAAPPAATGPADWRGYQAGATDAGGQPVSVDHKVTHADGSSTVIKHTSAQAKTPGQGAGGRTGGGGAPTGDPDPDAPYLRAAAAATQQGGGLGGPSGPQGAAGPTATVQVPAHPGLLQRIGQTIGHFFSGTLGQWAPQQGQTINLGTLPNQTQGNALSGVHHALAQGRQHIATNRGGTAPASAPPPPFPYQTNPEIGTWEAAGGLPTEGTPAFPYAAAPGVLRAGGTMPPPSQFNLASGYQ